MTLDWAKAIHTAIGIEYPHLFMVSLVLFGALFFGFIGWVVDKNYQVTREQAAQAAALAASQHSHAKLPEQKSAKSKTSSQLIQQSSKGSDSPNIVTGDNSKIDVRSKE